MRSYTNTIVLDSLILALLALPLNGIADHGTPLELFSPDKIPNKNPPITSQHCLAVAPDGKAELLCQVENTNGVVFDTKPILDISSQIDIRPESCQSFFDDYLHTRRGLRIEAAIHGAPQFADNEKTVSTFPIVDFIANKEAHVLVSKDLSSTIYISKSNDEPLYASIIEDAEAIEERFVRELAVNKSITAKANGQSTTIDYGEVESLTLHIVIQSGIPTLAQITQIRRAEKELRKRWNLKLKIIEIP